MHHLQRFSRVAAMLLAVVIVTVVGSWTNTLTAQDQHQFAFCQGNYALCSASTCTPTGNKIQVNGATQLFPEANCTCPVFSGVAIADLIGGTMQGSCAPPSPNGIWSWFSLMTHIPQEINGWQTSGPQAAAPPLYCPAALHLGNKQVNCFSFACDTVRSVNGVLVATCHCAVGESPAGESVPPPTAFLTQAGQGNLNFCSMYPVAGTISVQ